jgi:hypothetical protein
MNITKIIVTTSTEGLDGVPADLYAETAEEIVGTFYEGAEVTVEVADRYLDTKIEIEPSEGDSYEACKAYDETKDQIGRLLNEAFDAACARV